jgi:hypothetical protein
MNSCSGVVKSEDWFFFFLMGAEMGEGDHNNLVGDNETGGGECMVERNAATCEGHIFLSCSITGIN